MSGLSLDANVLLALWRPEPNALAVSSALGTFASRQRLVLSGPAYGELYGFYPNLKQQLTTLGVQVMPDMPVAAWQRAGEAHAAYARRRRQSGGGVPRRILTDFLIGAHASAHGLSLFTLNTADYADFPEVPLLTL